MQQLISFKNVLKDFLNENSRKFIKAIWFYVRQFLSVPKDVRSQK